MENAHVPLVASTWRPCLLCGLLLASKVWQDLRYFKFIAIIFYTLPQNIHLCTFQIIFFIFTFFHFFSSWNSEISQIYPQFSLQSINRLERMFCQEIKWDLYISSSAYAKYYFALRSLTEKKDFRRDYNVMMINAPNADQVAERSTGIKESFLMSKSL